jgi:hypothetical protein
MKPTTAAPALWAAWVKDKPRGKWRCVVRCAASPDHAAARLETLLRGQFASACYLPAGADPPER